MSTDEAREVCPIAFPIERQAMSRALSPACGARLCVAGGSWVVVLREHEPVLDSAENPRDPAFVAENGIPNRSARVRKRLAVQDTSDRNR